jgi:hypothetical protein
MPWLAAEIHWARRDRPLRGQVRPTVADRCIDEGRLSWHRPGGLQNSGKGYLVPSHHRAGLLQEKPHVRLDDITGT